MTRWDPDAAPTPAGGGSGERSRLRSFDGTWLACTARGAAGAPLVLLVHGLGESAEVWDRVAELLSGRYRVITYDLRGHGRSGPARWGRYHLPAHGRDLDTVLAAVVDPGRRALVVGHSLGGGVVLARAAVRGTDRLAGAVFAGSAGAAVTAPGLPAQGRPRWVGARLRSAWLAVLVVAARLGRHLGGLRALSDRAMRHFAFAPDEPGDLVARARRRFLRTRPRALAGSALAALGHDGTRLGPSLDVPALVLRGSADPEVSADEIRRLVAGLPDSELVTLPGAGHMLPLTHPDAVAAHVARWADRVQAAPPASSPDRNATQP